MFPYNYTYDPYSPSRYGYGAPSYGGRSDSQYLQALAEEEAARRQYAEALREQENARNRAARARLARQAYENPYFDAYLGDEDDSGYGYPNQRTAYPSYPSYPGSYLSPEEQRALLRERQQLEQQRREQQRRIEMLEREREKERQRIRALEEERRRQLLEEERRRRVMLEEEERQRRREMERRRREEEDFLRRNSSQEEAFSPLDELFGFRPSRFMQPETSNARRARTTSPNYRTRQAQAAQNQRRTPVPPTSQAQRAPSRTPQPERTTIPISSPRSSPRPEERKPSPPPRQYTPEEAAAAEKIQQFWRPRHQRRKALASIAEIDAKFQDVKSRFVLPSALDYTVDGQQLSVPTTSIDASSPTVEKTEGDAKLAYTPNNAPVHGYEEELNRLLTKLDGVQSGGDEEVRNKRRQLVRRVEMEAERIENIKVLVWRAWVSRSKDEDAEMHTEESTKEQPAESSTSATEIPVDVSSEQMDVDDSQPSSSQPEPSTDSTPANNSSTFPQSGSPSTVTEDVEVRDATEDADTEAMEVESSVNNNASQVDTHDSSPASVDEPQLSSEDTMQVEASEESTANDSAVDVDVSVEDSGESPQATDSVPVIVEEPDPDADTTEQSSAEEDMVDESPESTEVVVIEPQSGAATPRPPSPIDETEPEVEHIEHPSDPGLVYSPSDAGESTPPHTPPASHDHLRDAPTEPSKESTPKQHPLTPAQRVQMLRPLFDREWEEEFDLF